MSDTGIGIPQEKIESIFQSFSQADVSDTRKYGGSGLGLSISKSIIELMGGKINVESREAEGSKFWFEIPLEFGEIEDDDRLEFDDEIIICLGSEDENKAMGQKVRSVAHIEPQLVELEELEQLSSDDLEGVLVIDWYIWCRLNRESKERLKGIKYIALSIPPNCLSDLEWNQKSFEGFAGGLLVKPNLKTQLKKVLQLEDELSDCFKGDEEVQSSEPDVWEEMSAEGKSCKILVVDDNALNVEVTRAVLAHQGYDVDVAFDGKQAVGKAKLSSYDLIIMDCQMPVMDGYDATKAIRTLETKMKNVPIIAFTANAFREAKEKCFESGMNDFITKPVKQDRLVSLVEKYIETN